MDTSKDLLITIGLTTLIIAALNVVSALHVDNIHAALGWGSTFILSLTLIVRLINE